MTGERPATIPSERGQSAVNGGRGSPLIALVDRSPVTQVFMPKTCWIKCAPPGAFPPSDKMGEVMSYDLHGRRCASLRLQECKILLNRWMLSPLSRVTARLCYSTTAIQILRHVKTQDEWL